MKKFFTLSLMAMFAGASITAQTLTTITTDEDVMYFGGHQPLAISPNGRYVSGSTAAFMMFTYDMQAQKSVVFTSDMGSAYENWGAELRDINNNGVAVGFDDNGGVIIDENGNYNLIEPFSDEANIILFERVSEDGSIIVGSVSDASWMQKACYWENGEKKFLPAPTSEEMGFSVNGTAAKFVSADGKTIVGWIVDDFDMTPMIIWERQDDGTYVLNPVCKGLFEPKNDYMFDDNWDFVGWDRGTNPYLKFNPAGISADGKTIAMHIMENINADNPSFPPVKIGLYDVATGELKTLADADGNHGLEPGCGFNIGAVSNDGTVVGYTGDGFFEPIRAFIMYGDEKMPKLFTEVFGDLEGMESYIEFADMGGTLMATSISSDGRYITGYGEFIDWDTYMIGYKGFVIDTQNSTGIGSVNAQPNDKVEYYTINGRKVDAPVKGLNIVRMSNGETKKIVVK